MAKRKKKQNIAARIGIGILNYFVALLVWIILAIVALVIGLIPVLNKGILEDALAPDYWDYDYGY